MYVPNPPPPQKKKKVGTLFKLKLNTIPDKKVLRSHNVIATNKCFRSISHLSQSSVAPVPARLKQVAAIKLRLTTYTASQLFLESGL